MKRWMTGGVVGSAVLAAGLLASGVAWAQEPGKLDEEAFKRILTYKFGQDAKDLNAISALVIGSFNDHKLRTEVEKRLIAILGTAEATFECKQFVCRQLVNAGTADSVPALAALLPDKELSHMGRYALERMQCREAGKALRDALGKTEGQTLIGVINSVGERRDREAVDALVKFLKGGDVEVAAAAASALGKIGGEDAASAIAGVRANAAPKLRPVADNAYLRCADQFLAGAEKRKAEAIYEALSAPAERENVRAAALRGLIAAGGEKAVSLVLKALTGDQPALRAIALSQIREVPGAEATKAFAGQVSKLAPDLQVLVLEALADRGDAAAMPAVVEATKSQDEKVRVAALKVLAALGDASAVPLLVQAAVGEAAPEADAARFSLNLLRGKGVDEAILDALRDGNPKVRVELVKCLSARRASTAVSVLVKATQDPDTNVRQEAFKALGSLADEKALPGLLSLLVKAQEEAERAALEKAILAICGKAKDEAARTSALLAPLPEAKGPGKAALLRILGKFGGEKPLEAVRAALKDQDAQVQDAAIRSLAGWPDAGPADTLLELVKSAANETHRVLALRGYVRLIALPSDLPISEVLKRFEEAMRLAARPDERKLVLSAVADVHHPDALKMVQAYAADPALKAEAEAAAKKIQDGMNAPPKCTASHNSEKAGNAIDGKPETRWDTGHAMVGEEWFMLELPVEKEISKITLDAKGSGGDYPRGYEVCISRDGKSWGPPVTKGEGKSAVVEIAFKPTSGRFVKIVQTGKSNGLFWSIHELTLEAK